MKEEDFAVRLWSTDSVRDFHVTILALYWSQFVPDLSESIKHVNVFVALCISSTLICLYCCLQLIFAYLLLQTPKNHNSVFFKESKAVHIAETHG